MARDRYIERMQAAKEIAQQIVKLCEAYERTASQTTVNKFVVSVERLADLAEDIEVDQTTQILDA